jgi:hypothetical protein
MLRPQPGLREALFVRMSDVRCRFRCSDVTPFHEKMSRSGCQCWQPPSGSPGATGAPKKGRAELPSFRATRRVSPDHRSSQAPCDLVPPPQRTHRASTVRSAGQGFFMGGQVRCAGTGARRFLLKNELLMERPYFLLLFSRASQNSHALRALSNLPSPLPYRMVEVKRPRPRSVFATSEIRNEE